MSDHSDGISEFVGASLRTALTVAIGGVHYAARLRVQRERVRQATLDAERQRLEADLEVQRTEARAKLAAVDRPGWIDQATPEEIAEMWHTATAWRDAGDKHATEVADRIKRQVQEKYDVDLEHHQVNPEAVRINLESAARLLDIERPGWFENATIDEIVDWLETARAWRDQGDERAGQAVERIRRQVLDKFGIDVHDPLVHPTILRETLEAAARELEAAAGETETVEADPEPPLLAEQNAIYADARGDFPPEPSDEGVPPDPDEVAVVAQAGRNAQLLRDYEADFAVHRIKYLEALTGEPAVIETAKVAAGHEGRHPIGAVSGAVATATAPSVQPAPAAQRGRVYDDPMARDGVQW